MADRLSVYHEQNLCRAAQWAALSIFYTFIETFAHSPRQYAHYLDIAFKFVLKNANILVVLKTGKYISDTAVLLYQKELDKLARKLTYFRNIY